MNSRHRRLRDWKEIAAFFGRDERTVRRWERQRGLPVHRVSGGARNLVFAYTDELENWLRSGGGAPAKDEAEEAAAAADGTLPAAREGAEISVEASLPAASAAPPPARRNLRPLAMAAACVVGLVAVTGAVTAYVRPNLPAKIAYTPEPRVQDLYLDAVYSLGTRQASGLTHAMRLLTEATTLDPDYADAYVKLAEAYNMVSQYTLMPPGEAYPRALAAANRAISLDPGNAEAHAALAFTTFYWSKDFPRSRALFEEAIALDPDIAQTHHWYALTLMVTGETELPLREIGRAQELSPESRAILANKGLILFYAGRTSEALTILEQLASAEPHLRSPHEYLATIYLDQGRMADFLREYRTSAEISGNAARLAIADAAEKGLHEPGDGFLTRMLDEQIRQFEKNLEPAYKVAGTAAMLGRKDEAIHFLQESIRRGEDDMLGISIEPPFKNLRTEARYRAIVERIGYAPAEESGS
jgi:tetratricopeptide (TPR) repeat protein